MPRGTKSVRKPASPSKATLKKKQAKQATRARGGARARAGAAAISLKKDIGDLIDQLRTRPKDEFRISVRRPDDLVVFDLVFDNLKLIPGTSPKLVRSDAKKAASLTVELPPQSFGEEAFRDATSSSDYGSPSPPSPPFPEKSPGVQQNVGSPADPLPPMPAARVRMSGKSRLSFTMPADIQEIGFNLASMLAACRTWPQRLDAMAAPEPPLILRPGAQVGKGWLKGVTASSNWSTISDVLVDALQKTASPDAVRLVADAGARIGAQAATALAADRTSDLQASLEQALTAEADSIAKKFPQLGEGQGRDVTIAALSLKATESLATSPAKFGDDLSFSVIVPFLPILLTPHAPAADVTALELPYRLYVSPIESARWLHRDLPSTNPKSGRTELWHTHLTTSAVDVGADAASKIRAIWSPDYPRDDVVSLANSLLPFRMSLDPLDRQMLVKLMAGYNEKSQVSPRSSYVPHASVAHRLMLSALGGLLDAEGSWDPRPQGVDLQQWRHVATLGRDHYVRVVYAGYLLPFGHHASLIKVTERKFEPSNPAQPTANRVAVLRQRFFIVVREHVKTYPGAGQAAGWYDFPFSRVEILTDVTPSLLSPDDPACRIAEASGQPIYAAGVPFRAAFWPMLAPDANTGNFRFEIAATDISGNRATFAMPLLFIGEDTNTLMAGADSVAARVVAAYNLAAEDPRRSGPTAGASVCYAPIDPGKDGDPRLPTSSLIFFGKPASGGTTVPHFNPGLRAGMVGIRQVQRLLGVGQDVRVEYPTIYATSGFAGGNGGEVFLKLPTPHELKFGGAQQEAKSDALGALASPAMAIQGLSRIVGPVAASLPSGGQSVEDTLQKVISNSFDPTDFFKGAKILGGVDLGSVLKTVALAAGDVPRMVSRELPDKIEASFDWETEIKQTDDLHLLVPGAGGPTMLSMHGHVSAPIGDPQGATFTATANLTLFKVNLFGFIIIWFDALSFKASRGTKPDVSVTMHPGDDAITFGGPLEFVNDLRQFIPSNGFSDPPSLSVTPSGISASYSLNLPSIGVGIFSLTNASLGAGFSLPFDSEPVEVTFNFSQRDHPFSLTVSLFGGGGFFAIGIGTDGVREIEAALEFGAAVAIDLGVASGSVEVKGGVYFHWLESGTGKTVELSGYVRLHGELSVLGIISASLTFNLQLGYLKQTPTCTVYGEATLVVEIDILFFSASVSVTCRREFGGSKSDPTFIDLVPAPAAWADYCSAFAAE